MAQPGRITESCNAKDSSWSQASIALGGAIEQLHERLNILDGRLQMVCGQPSPTKCQEDGKFPVNAPIIAEMVTHIQRVVGLRDMVDELIRRLEI